MAQFYTLEEAASKLGLGADDFKRRLKTESLYQNLRPFRDGTTLRFRSADIDELARSLGAASDPGLTLGSGSSSDDFEMLAADPRPRTPADPPLLVTDDGDLFGLGTKGKKGDSDSDVRLDLASPRPYDPNALNPTEEIDLAGPSSAVIKSSGLSGKTPKSGTKLGSDTAKGQKAIGKTTGEDSSSEFELSLDAADDSFDFQLAKSGDSSDEVDLSDAAAPENRGGLSGINLAKPSDSGVSLEGKKGPKTGPLKRVAAPDDSDIDFELSLDPVPPSGGGSGRGRNKPPAAQSADSDSEFELTLDDNSGVMDAIGQQVTPAKGKGKGKPVSAGSDIIETDFELPAMDSDSSDFELTAGSDESDVAEAVELVEDEGGAVAGIDAFDESEPVASPSRSGRRSGRNLLDSDDLDDGPSASAAMRGYGDRGGAEYDAAPAEQVTVVEKDAPWGPLPAIVLLLCLPLVFLGTLMSFEAVRGMMGYQTGSGPGSALVRAVAGALGEKIAD